tara:strand:+ start:704 stop:841 length:138 start_codon:yes stop_codon:yes gene_type:complete
MMADKDENNFEQIIKKRYSIQEDSFKFEFYLHGGETPNLVNLFPL